MLIGEVAGEAAPPPIEPAEKLGERLLDFGVILREELFELIDDDERLLLALAPPGDERHCHLRVFEAQQELHRVLIARDELHERLR